MHTLDKPLDNGIQTDITGLIKYRKNREVDLVQINSIQNCKIKTLNVRGVYRDERTNRASAQSYLKPSNKF